VPADLRAFVLYICASMWVVQVLNAIPDQDTFYDVSDVLEEQGLEKVIGRYRSRKGVERDLLNQFNLYEAMLRHEDGVSDSSAELSSHMDNIRSLFLPLSCRIDIGRKTHKYCNSDKDEEDNGVVTVNDVASESVDQSLVICGPHSELCQTEQLESVSWTGQF